MKEQAKQKAAEYTSQKLQKNQSLKKLEEA